MNYSEKNEELYDKLRATNYAIWDGQKDANQLIQHILSSFFDFYHSTITANRISVFFEKTGLVTEEDAAYGSRSSASETLYTNIRNNLKVLRAVTDALGLEPYTDVLPESKEEIDAFIKRYGDDLTHAVYARESDMRSPFDDPADDETTGGDKNV